NFLGFQMDSIDNPFEFLVSQLHPEDRNFMSAFLERLSHASSEDIIEKYFRLQHKEGHWVHFYERAKIFSRHTDGSVCEYLAVIQDITESVKAQYKLEESERRYRNFISYSFDGIYYMRFEKPIPINLPIVQQVDMYYQYGYVDECNVSFARMYGYDDPSVLAGLRVIDVHGGEHFEYNRKSTFDFIESNYQVANSETVEQDASGRMIHILNHAIGDIKDGYLFGIWGTQQDITERRKAEFALQQSESILKGIVNALPDLKFRINKDFVFLDYYESENENEPPLIAPSKFLGKKLEEVLPDTITKAGVKAIEMALRYKKIQTFEYFFPINEEMHYYEGRVSPMNENEVILAIRNVSDQRKTQMELREKLRELDEKNKELTAYIESNSQLENFAYIASHDLREPIRTIHSFAQLVQKNYQPILDEKGQNYLRFIINGAENMNFLIEDLLTYSRVSSEEIIFESIELTGLVQDVIKNLTSFIIENEANIYLSLMPSQIIANRIRIKQLFQNLLVNAIKFHQEGVIPEIYINGIEHGEYWLFEIKDNGIGIAPEMQDKIFQLFKKIHRHRQYPGTGIGLALCKRIIEQHGGEIWVESILGKGSSFYFTIKKKWML
ncbi:MAG: ATP-binding protein, partial [Saprospiraceae bacterium]|nr:ATP-binding protein [Saprospiraceae bacterium]